MAVEAEYDGYQSLVEQPLHVVCPLRTCKSTATTNSGRGAGIGYDENMPASGRRRLGPTYVLDVLDAENVRDANDVGVIRERPVYRPFLKAPSPAS